MRLTRIAGECPDGVTCPTVFATDRASIVVQGYELAADELAKITLPSGETAVEIPVSLLKEAARAYSD
ncbi:hypothetical protein CLV63_112212 [Murinocardiopsis flavida]|uniref:Uncharacterized protein n=1 Tax=Murinocardiopsis flavida TaxID=645275 RepID=A0A2P8DGI2_9ACTN|nr:hypothetical protein [Murinocardiopsis flavida]PSK96327.1 hypothetical protein CLV63_112212 [Murinocardiopsis flavida]